MCIYRYVYNIGVKFRVVNRFITKLNYSTVYY